MLYTICTEITTSTVDIREETGGRPVQKAKVNSLNIIITRLDLIMMLKCMYVASASIFWPDKILCILYNPSVTSSKIKEVKVSLAFDW